MIEFDHAGLAAKLAKISRGLRPVFAAMVAERLFPHVVAFFGRHDPNALKQLRSALEQVWAYGFNGTSNEDERDAALNASMAAIQAASKVATSEETYPLTAPQRKAAEEMGIKALRLRDVKDHSAEIDAAFFAENAASAIAYGLRAIASDDPREPAWAGQTAYDTVDRFVLMQESELGKEWTEAQVRAHPVVQQELQRQLDDIKALETASKASKQDKDKLAKLREAARRQAQSIFSAQA